MRIDLGCGSDKREGYVGVDLTNYEGVDYVVNLEEEGLPFRDGEVEEIFTSHFLEHLPGNRVPAILKDCYRVLKPGGTMEIVVPDLLKVCEAFLKASEEERWGFPLMTIFGEQGTPGNFHKTGFSKKRLMQLTVQAGLWPEACLNVLSHMQTCILLKCSKRS